MFKPAPKAFRAGFNCGVHNQPRKPSGFQSRGCCIESKKTGFGRESRIQRWRFLALSLGAVPQADSERRAFGAEHIRQRGRQAGGCKVYDSFPLGAESTVINTSSLPSYPVLSF
jgi:hypothetical protein